MCEFTDGTIVEADYSNIAAGNVRNPNHPNVYGVGYIGQGPWKSSIDGRLTKEYVTWTHMMRRCYSEKSKDENPTYIGTTVCEKWHCFQDFCEDIIKLSGYKEWKTQDGYELDKDIICEAHKIFPKVYSLLTCLFIKKCENLSESTSRNNKLRARKFK